MRLDLPALDERLILLHLVRALVATATVVVALGLPDPFTVAPAAVVLAAASLLVLTTIVELSRRTGRLTTEAGVRALLVADAGFLALTTAWSGEATSPLVPVALLELVAVTILLSWRTGLEAAAADSAAFAVVHLAVLVGLVPGAGDPAEARSVAAVLLAFGACTALTAACSSYDRRALRQSGRHLRALSALALALEHETDAAAVSEVLARHVGRHLHAAGVAVLVPARDSTLAVTWSPDGLTRRPLAPGLADDGLVAAARRSRAPVPFAPSPPGTGASLVRQALPGARHGVVVVMRTAGDDLGGVLALGTGRPPSAAAVEVLRQAAAHGGAALRNARLLAELERRATVDPLTGLANRRALDDRLERELSRGRREGAPVSLVLVDIDHFKEVNDVHGHAAGDRALRSVAQVLATGVRDIDLPARYGGEEFVVLLPGTALDDAAVTADRLRRDVAAAVTDPVRVTVSAGVASFPLQARTGAELLERADTALYEAKASGRDRVVTAPTGPRPAGSPGPGSRPRAGSAPRRTA